MNFLNNTLSRLSLNRSSGKSSETQKYDLVGPKNGPKPYPTHQYKNLDHKNLFQDLQAYGVVVIENIYSKKHCDKLMDETIENFEKLNTGISKKNLKKTWKQRNLPPQTPFGSFPTVVTHMKPVWEVRNDEKIIKIVEEMYLRERQKTEPNIKNLPLTVSIDAINIQPNHLKKYEYPFDIKSDPDWEHMDHSTKNATFKCIQGQISLTNTTAGFRCSPKSHLVCDDILDLHKNIEPESNWCKIGYDNKEKVRKLVEEKAGGSYQIPIIVPAGSLILWYSSVVHSAVSKSRVEKKTSKDRWLGWRGVYYLCYRPTDEFTEKQLETRKENIRNNRSMTHLSIETVPEIRPFYECHENIRTLADDPKAFYQLTGWSPDVTW